MIDLIIRLRDNLGRANKPYLNYLGKKNLFWGGNDEEKKEKENQ
jgi:hypothetical protein